MTAAVTEWGCAVTGESRAGVSRLWYVYERLESVSSEV